jgi:methylthioribose-1-phosphate isomerase
MKVYGQSYRTIWINEKGTLSVINQLRLPHTFEICTLKDIDEVCDAICNMMVRGAGLIGATAAYGIWVAATQAPTDTIESFENYIHMQAKRLQETRPTASNLAWAIARQLEYIKQGKTITEKLLLQNYRPKLLPKNY